jgi:hypothetical protein
MAHFASANPAIDRINGPLEFDDWRKPSAGFHAQPALRPSVEHKVEASPVQGKVCGKQNNCRRDGDRQRVSIHVARFQYER